MKELLLKTKNSQVIFQLEMMDVIAFKFVAIIPILKDLHF